MDNDFDVELTGSDDLTPPACMIAVSNVFAHARKQMSLAEQKTFALALTKVRWTKGAEDQTPVVYLDKKILARILGYTSDSTDLSQNLWSAIHGLARQNLRMNISRSLLGLTPTTLRCGVRISLA